ncbi:MAG: BMP family ABC transporter substrate-binding protein [Anaerolineaceae bacterium]
MKKSILFVAIILIASLVLGACGTPAAAPTETAAPAVPAAKVYNVVSLVNGNLGDKSFFDSAESGLKELAAAGRITYKTIEMGGTDQDQPKWLETLNEVASSGEYDLIICGTYQMPDYLKEAATTYPDQKFLIYDDNTYVGVNPNVVNITYKQNDMGYLIGTFAARMTVESGVDKINPEAVVGFIGGIDSPVINDFLYGFLLGAQAANPDIKVDTRYVNSYVDTATAKEMGLSMINDKKADILWGVAGLSGNGGAEAALESGKAWFIGVDSDQELTLPTDQAAITLTSGLKNVGKSIVWLFDEWDAGRTYFGQEQRLGIPEGGVGVVIDKNFAKIAPKSVQDAVLAAQTDIVSGKITVATAIGDTTNAVVALRDSLQP